MSRSFDIIRALVRGHSTAPPAASNGDSTVHAEPPTNEPSAEPPSAEPIAAVTMITPVQIILIVLGTIGFLYFARNT